MTLPVPPNDPAWPLPDEAIRKVFEAMLADGSWGRYHGPHCLNLTTALADYHAVEHVMLCSSGTAAVELALRGAGVTAGDEVILSAYDFKANFVNILILGATPVLVDTLPGLPVLDSQQLSEAITDRTRALICSHLHGSLTPMRPICEFAQSRGIVVIEDACQAPGAVLEGRRAGSWGDIGVLSFGGSKLLTAGRGGALLTRDRGIAQRVRLYTQRGNQAYPLSEMQAAVLLPQLLQLDERNQRRWLNVQHLNDLLASQNRITLALSSGNTIPPDRSPGDSSAEILSRPEIPSIANRNLPVFYKLALVVNHVTQRTESEQISADLRQRGVAVDSAFQALHRIHSRRRFRAVGDLTNATQLHHQLLTLHHPILLNAVSDMSTVASTLTRAERP